MVIDYAVHLIWRVLNLRHGMPRHYLMPSPLSPSYRHYEARLREIENEYREVTSGYRKWLETHGEELTRPHCELDQ